MKDIAFGRMEVLFVDLVHIHTSQSFHERYDELCAYELNAYGGIDSICEIWRPKKALLSLNIVCQFDVLCDILECLHGSLMREKDWI
jgi:hypothetical protein